MSPLFESDFVDSDAFRLFATYIFKFFSILTCPAISTKNRSVHIPTAVAEYVKSQVLIADQPKTPSPVGVGKGKRIYFVEQSPISSSSEGEPSPGKENVILKVSRGSSSTLFRQNHSPSIHRESVVQPEARRKEVNCGTRSVRQPLQELTHTPGQAEPQASTPRARFTPNSGSSSQAAGPAVNYGGLNTPSRMYATPGRGTNNPFPRAELPQPNVKKQPTPRYFPPSLPRNLFPNTLEYYSAPSVGTQQQQQQQHDYLPGFHVEVNHENPGLYDINLFHEIEECKFNY